MAKSDKNRIIISGGGTGGHIFPAISIAQALQKIQPNVELLFVGAEGRMEMQKVPEAGYPIEGLWISGLQRKLSLANLAFPFKVLSSLWKSRKIIKRFKPELAIGVGGYASGPLLQAATWMGIPTLIQEQNSYPGITNKLLAKNVDKICVAYDGLERFFPKEKIIMTGNPVRSVISQAQFDKAAALQHFGLSPDKKVVFVTGGSLGARGINEGIKACLDTFRQNDIQLLWQTGKFYIDEMQQLVTSNDTNFKLMPFVRKMDLAYACADVIVARAGASTISELCFTAQAVILMPSPNVTEDHQTHNAMSLVNKNAALIVKDKDAPQTLSSTIMDLLNNPQKQTDLGKNLKQLAISDAADHIAKEALALIK